LWAKDKRNKEILGRKIAYTGHFRPSGRTKAANWAIFRP